MSKETVKGYGVKFSTANVNMEDGETAEYLVTPVGSKEDGAALSLMLAISGIDNNATVGYYEFDLEDGAYVGNVFGNGELNAYEPGDGLREVAED